MLFVSRSFRQNNIVSYIHGYYECLCMTTCKETEAQFSKTSIADFGEKKFKPTYKNRENIDQQN